MADNTKSENQRNDQNAMPNASGGGSGKINTNTMTSQSSARAGRSEAQSNQRPSTIDEALRLLDHAITSEGRSLKDLVTSEYSGLQDAIRESAPMFVDRLKGMSDRAMDQVRGAAQSSVERSRDVLGQVESRVRANPWAYIGGAAIGCLAIGVLLARRSSDEYAPPVH